MYPFSQKKKRTDTDEKEKNAAQVQTGCCWNSICVAPRYYYRFFSYIKSSDIVTNLSKEQALNVTRNVVALGELFIAEELKAVLQLSINDALIKAATKVADQGLVLPEAIKTEEMKRANKVLQATQKTLGDNYESIFLVNT